MLGPWCSTFFTGERLSFPWFEVVLVNIHPNFHRVLFLHKKMVFFTKGKQGFREPGGGLTHNYIELSRCWLRPERTA